MTLDEIAAARRISKTVKDDSNEFRKKFGTTAMRFEDNIADTIERLCDEVERLQSCSRLSPVVWDLLFNHLSSHTRWDSQGYAAAKQTDMLEGGDKNVKEYLSDKKYVNRIEVNEGSKTWVYVRGEP